MTQLLADAEKKRLATRKQNKKLKRKQSCTKKIKNKITIRGGAAQTERSATACGRGDEAVMKKKIHKRAQAGRVDAELLADSEKKRC